MNALYVQNLYKTQGLPVFFIELVYKGREPEIHDALHVSGESILFHKENLYRVLEPTIPEIYTKLAFLDADVFFSEKDWYSKTSEALETHDIVQPFEEAIWFDITYTKEILRKKTIVLSGPVFDDIYHPGFAWCMRREWYNQQGFFDFAFSGGGDRFSSAAWMQKNLPLCLIMAPIPLRTAYKDYYGKPPPRITYLEGMTVSHLFHGTRENRNYWHRHKLVDSKEPIELLLTTNSSGVLEWRDKEKYNPLFLTYFQGRQDDSI